MTMVLVLAPAAALAAPPKPKPIDVKPMTAKLSVYHDDLGQYYVLPTPGQWDDFDAAGNYVFFGDGKTMWQQRVVGSGAEPGGSAGPEFEWNLWSPRVKDMSTASLVSHANEAILQCTQRHADDRKLVPLRADEAKVFFNKATFLPPLWQRQSAFLARDDDGTYYFVDQLREEFGGKDYRVFAGPKGQLKELPMTNVVQDSGGFIFATKGGQLKIIATANNEAYWVKGGKKIELTMLEPTDNRYLIYRELGVYNQLGVVCDDL
ncbi:MAG TPA: hypothetical protein VGL61_07135 [Kofleriaceae bacterium]